MNRREAYESESHEGFRQVVVHPDLWQWLVDGLYMQGLELDKLPPEAQTPGDLPTYGINPSDELMETVRRIAETKKGD